MSKIQNLDQTYSIRNIDKETLNIKVYNNEILIAIVGEFNKNLNKLETLTKTKIFFRGNSITIKGEKESIEKVSEAMKFLVNKYIKTKVIEDQDLTLSVKLIKDIKHKADIHNLDQLLRQFHRLR